MEQHTKTESQQVASYNELVEALDNLLIQLSPMFNFDYASAPEYIQKAKKVLDKAAK